MSAGQVEVFSSVMSVIHYEEVSKLHSYWCFTLLILLSLVNAVQRSAIQYMYHFATTEEVFQDPYFSIRAAVPDFTDEKFMEMTGDMATIIYAFMVLVTGSVSDLFNRKSLLCGSTFIWCLATYLSAFCSSYWQLNALRMIQSFFSSFLGPCSYSLITDWIPPHQRTMAFAIFALGVGFGGTVAPYNSHFIAWLGWEAAFQFTALMGFVLLGISILSFDEPDRGRFDIAHSVINNPDESLKSGSRAYGAYELSEATRQLKI